MTLWFLKCSHTNLFQSNGASTHLLRNFQISTSHTTDLILTNSSIQILPELQGVHRVRGQGNPFKNTVPNQRRGNRYRVSRFPSASDWRTHRSVDCVDSSSSRNSPAYSICSITSTAALRVCSTWVSFWGQHGTKFGARHEIYQHGLTVRLEST